VRTARPELVRRTLLLLEGSPAALDIIDVLRMAPEGGIMWWRYGSSLSGLGVYRERVDFVGRTFA
jgi:hypothetical protein